MLLWIIAAGMLCVALGLPVLPVLVLGGLAMALAAYFLTRSKNVLSLGIGLGTVAAAHYLVTGMMQASPGAPELPEWMISLATSDALVGFLAVVVIVASMIIGIFGPLMGLPFDPESLVKHAAKTKREGPDSSDTEK